MNDFENNLHRQLNASIDMQLGPRRAAPPLNLERGRRRRRRPSWLLPLVAAAAVAAVGVGVTASVTLADKHSAPPATVLPTVAPSLPTSTASPSLPATSTTAPPTSGSIQHAPFDLAAARRVLGAYVQRHSQVDGQPSFSVPLPGCPLGNVAELISAFPGVGAWSRSADDNSSVIFGGASPYINCNAVGGHDSLSPGAVVAVQTPTSLETLISPRGRLRLTRVGPFDGGMIYAGTQPATTSGTSPQAADCGALWFAGPNDISVYVGIRGGNTQSATGCTTAMETVLAHVIDQVTHLPTTN